MAIHLSLALSAVLVGPVAFWSRLGTIRPRLHRAMGYAWLTCMAGAAFSAIFIRDFGLPNWRGYTPIHLLVPVTFSASAKACAPLQRAKSACTAAPCKRPTSWRVW